MPDLTDEELMVSFQQGDAAAFERLFERYRVPLFNYLLRLLSYQRESAEDVLQNIFIKLARSRDLYDSRAPFRPWIYTITRNHGLNHLRSRAAVKARMTVSADEELIGPSGERSAHEWAGPDDTFGAIASREEGCRLMRIIERLTSPAKEIFLLRAVDGLSHEEIARMLNLNPATVRTHFHRARAQLCRLLANPAP